MTALAMVALGFGMGLGVLVAGRGLRPRPASLDAVLLGLARRGRGIDDGGPPRLGARPRGEAAALRLIVHLGVDAARWHRDLAVLDRTPMRQASEKLLGAGAGSVVPLAAGLTFGLIGSGPSLSLIVLGSASLGVGGFLLPNRLLRERADARRGGFRHALSSYLDLVNVLLAGGAGIESALHAAADVGDGWGYRLIRSELRRARLMGRAPWDTFAALGERIGVPELTELAANVSLAGTHGARIRASLAAKADTLRGLQVAETEAAAEAATERMTVPIAVLLLAFLLLISYPAVAQITAVGGPQP